MASEPKELLLRFRAQKNGKVTIYAPNGDAHVLEGGGEAAAVAQRIGAVVLEVLADEEQPITTVEPGGRATSSGPSSSASSSDEPDREGAFRGFLNSLVPGGEKALDFLQELSGPGGKAK